MTLTPPAEPERIAMKGRYARVFLLCLHLLPTGLSAAIHPAPAPLFRDPIYDGAADPVVIWNRPEQSWWMLYTQRRANVESADVAYCYGNRVGIASSRDQGQSWLCRGTLDLEDSTLVCEHENSDFYLPNLAPETMMFADTFRNGTPFSKDPHVVHFGGRYLMYYSVPPYRKPHAPVKGWGIGIAESQNLIHWQRIGEVTPQADYEGKGLCAPCARVIEDRVHLFYQTYGNGKRDAICHAVSRDGLQFTRNSTNPIFSPTGAWTAGRAIDAEVIEFQGRTLLYFATRDPSMKIQMTGVAAAPLKTHFSRDQWTQLVEGPVIKPELPWEGKCVEGASIIPRNGKLYMFYAGNYNNAPQQVGVASSDDGLTWTRLSDQPFLPNGKPGEWNASESGHPHIFEDTQGRTWLFYQGNNDRGKTWMLSKVEVKWNDQGPYLEKEGP